MTALKVWGLEQLTLISIGRGCTVHASLTSSWKLALCRRRENTQSRCSILQHLLDVLLCHDKLFLLLAHEFLKFGLHFHYFVTQQTSFLLLQLCLFMSVLKNVLLPYFLRVTKSWELMSLNVSIVKRICSVFRHIIIKEGK